MKVVASAYGKLYLAGEYAVVEAGYPAVIAAINQQIFVRIESADIGSIHSNQVRDLSVVWKRKSGKLLFSDQHPYTLVESAMKVAEDYIRATGLPTQETYKLSITSELDNEETGQKYGLGSSGAVIVAVIKAILAYYGQQSTPEVIFKLAVLAQMRLNMKGSFGDIAASSYGGLIAYHSVNRNWLSQKMAELSVLDLVKEKWQGFSVEELEFPSPLRLMIGWTGNAASTDDLVSQVTEHRTQADKEDIHRQFLCASRSCVEGFILACKAGDASGVQLALDENRRLLRQFSQDMGMIIETPRLEKLCQIANHFGAVAKSSGAGGGDCGICLVETAQQRESISTAWAKAKIQELPLSIAARNQMKQPAQPLLQDLMSFVTEPDRNSL